MKIREWLSIIEAYRRLYPVALGCRGTLWPHPRLSAHLCSQACWLLIFTAFLEIFCVCKWGRDRYPNPTPVYVVQMAVAWVVFVGVLFVVAFHRQAVKEKMKEKVRKLRRREKSS